MNIIAITNVHVFDETKLSELKTVVIENGFISSKTTGDIVVDGHGGTLLPGLIDSHIHLDSVENLELAAHYGVTTMLDMGSRSSELVDKLRGISGLTDIRSCYSPACSPGGLPTSKMGYPMSSVVNGFGDAERFVAEQVALGADYIKLILEDKAIKVQEGDAVFEPETVVALVQAAHIHDRMVVAHVTSNSAYQSAADAGVDVLTHVPLDAPLSESIIDIIGRKGLIIVPTMVMMKGIANIFSNLPAHKFINFSNMEITLRAIIKEGIQVIAGTDSNNDKTAPCIIKFGESLHEELELFVKGGMSPIQAIQSATSVPAKLFGFNDRGVIKIGKRADLVLVDGDPTVDIKVTRAIKGVWIAGVQVR